MCRLGACGIERRHPVGERACSSDSTDNNSNAAAYYIENKGSDTIVNIALAWAEQYQIEHPEVSIAVTGGGSGTGIAALINQTADIANASRQIKGEEKEEAEANGVVPMEHIIARDAIAVVVNPENPVTADPEANLGYLQR